MFDDELSVVRNPQIRELWTGRVFITPANTAVAGRPLVNLSFAVNYALGKLNVRGYHLANLVFHLACGVLLFGLVRRTFEIPALRAALGNRSADLAFAVALLWTVHPLNSEVVDYVTERTESMMALCYLLTLYASQRALGSSSPARWCAIAVLACAAGMGCKESMVTAPLMVLIYDRVFIFGSIRQAWRTRWRFYGSLAATWLLLAALVVSQGQAASGGFATAHVSPWSYLLNQTVMVTHYLRLAVWPQALVLYYGWAHPVTPEAVWPYTLFIVLLLSATLVVFLRHPRIGFLGVWVFLTLAPTSSLLPIPTEVGAERRMYLPLMGLVTLAVIGAVRAWRGVRHLATVG